MSISPLLSQCNHAYWGLFDMPVRILPAMQHTNYLDLIGFYPVKHDMAFDWKAAHTHREFRTFNPHDGLRGQYPEVLFQVMEVSAGLVWSPDAQPKLINALKVLLSRR